MKRAIAALALAAVSLGIPVGLAGAITKPATRNTLVETITVGRGLKVERLPYATCGLPVNGVTVVVEMNTGKACVEETTATAF